MSPFPSFYARNEPLWVGYASLVHLLVHLLGYPGYPHHPYIRLLQPSGYTPRTISTKLAGMCTV